MAFSAISAAPTSASPYPRNQLRNCREFVIHQSTTSTLPSSLGSKHRCITGWLQLSRKPAQLPAAFSAERKNDTVEHIEILRRPRAKPDTPDSQLPFIPASEVTSKAASSGHPDTELWIVIDSVVYDCSEFVHEHPGGEDVIRSFWGARLPMAVLAFHGKKELSEFGAEIRVGRTEEVRNRLQEPVRYVGLRRLGGEEDW